MDYDIKQLIRDRRDAQIQLQDIESQLTSALQSFEGTLLEAIAIGLVRPNFPTPPGFKRYIRESFVPRQ